MTDTTVPPAATVTPETPAAPAAPAVPATPTHPPVATPDIQALIDAAVTARLERANKAAEKTLEERLAEVENQYKEQLATAEKSAVNALIGRAVANTHNPAVAAQLVAAQLGDLTSADEEGILAKAQEVLTANPWMVKDPSAPAPVASIPGAGAGGASIESAPNGSYMTDAEMEAVTPEELAADDNLAKRYAATVNR